MNISLLLAEREFKLKLRERIDNRIQVTLDETPYDIEVEFFSPDEFLLKIDGKVFDVIVTPNSNQYAVSINGKNIPVGKRSALQMLGNSGNHAMKREVKTSMPGRIIKLLVKEGEEVKEGQAVLILEAMKMQNEIKAPQPGRVQRIGPKAGDSVEAGALLFLVE